MRYYSVSEPDHTCAWRFTSVSVIRTSTFQLLCILFNSFVFILENLENMGKYTEYMGFPHSSVGKESACNAGDPNLIPGSGRSPGEGNSSTHSSVLAQRIPWTEEPGRFQSMGSQESDTT